MVFLSKFLSLFYPTPPDRLKVEGFGIVPSTAVIRHPESWPQFSKVRQRTPLKYTFRSGGACLLFMAPRFPRTFALCSSDCVFFFSLCSFVRLVGVSKETLAYPKFFFLGSPGWYRFVNDWDPNTTSDRAAFPCPVFPPPKNCT